MRAIDADALAEGYKHMGYDPTEHPEESYMEGWCKGFNAAVDHCMHHVIHAPTIEPRKKGRWYEITESDCSGYDPVLAGYEDPVVGYVCSCCGYGEEKEVMGETLWNFCPNCGSDMRGEQDDKS